MKLLSALLAAVLLVLALPAFAGPTIAFEKTALDFGKPVSGDTVKFSFPFKNTGDAELEIISVQPSCGCTGAKSTLAKVPAGGSAAIEADFNSTGFNGPVSKSITIVSNDSSNPVVNLIYTGDVVPVATLKPEIVGFGEMKAGTVMDTEVVMRPVPGTKFKILRIEPQGKRVSAKIYDAVPRKTGEFRIKVHVIAGKDPGRLYEQLKIVTDLPGNRPIMLSVFGNVVKAAKPNAKPS